MGGIESRITFALINSETFLTWVHTPRDCYQMGIFRERPGNVLPDGLLTPSRLVNATSETNCLHDAENKLDRISDPERTLGDQWIQAPFPDGVLKARVAEVTSPTSPRVAVAESGSPSSHPSHLLRHHIARYTSLSLLFAAHTLPFLPTSPSP